MKKLPPTKVPELIRLLQTRYGKLSTALAHEDAFQLLVATILSAQTTDKRVNMVTPALFAAYPDARALAAAKESDVEQLIGSVNFFRTKAKNIVAMAKVLGERHGGAVPRSLDELVELPGVARKTANVVLGTVWGIASGVVVDTHVARLSQLLGLSSESEPHKIERELMALVPKDEWVRFGHMLIHHGREVCVARRPQCDACLLNELCPSAFVAQGYKGEQAATKSERGAKKAAKKKAKQP